MPNFAALRAAVFLLSTKNLRGGRISAPPSVRGLNNVPNKYLMSYWLQKQKRINAFDAINLTSF